MKRLMVLGAVWALAVAKPELYKEKEDFQFSRSSSDDGNKSGYYGAQRGNMGGNFERAHNMDSLAQHQMGGLVKQVEGELGDGANMRTGSVYSAANSRGTYGSGKLDLSNLGGRNFQEGATYGNSQSSQSQQAASAYNAAAYTNSHSQSSRHSGYQATGQSGYQGTGQSGYQATGQSGYQGTGQSGYQATGQSGYQATGQSGYQATGHSGLNHQSDDLQALTDHSQGNGQYDYGRQTSQAAGYNAQSGFQQHSSYDASNSNLHSGGYGSNVHTRLISATPVRVIVTPGGRVAIPIAAQTYDLTRGSALIDQNSLNSEAEVLSNDNQRTVYRVPVNSNAKHYESSYNYRKEWEKHDTIPSTVISPTSTDNPFPKNSELYEDGQAQRTGSQHYDTRTVDSQRANSAYGGYNAAVKTTSGQSRFNYDTQRNAASQTNENAYSGAGYGTSHQGTSSDGSLNGYNVQSQYNTGRYHGASADALTQAAAHNTGYNAAADLNSQVENLNSKPKSYQSAYSYHKSWERQGDPYVIKPSSAAYYDGQSAQRLTTGSAQNLGYSTGSHYQHSHASGADCDENGHLRVARSVSSDQLQDMQQQSQNLDDLGQQSQNLEDFGQQQSQNLEYFGQQQQSQNLQDFGQQQQSQNLEDLGQQQQSQNLEDFGQQQQSQNLEDFGQQQQSQNLEDFGQQQQSQNLEDFGQQQQSQNLEDFGQQQQQNLGQQTEFQWDTQQEGGQQTQNTWDNIETLSQPTNNKWDDMQHTWDKFQDLGQKPQDNQNDLGQRPQATETGQKNNTQDQQAQDKWSFNFNSQDQQHEQSNKFNQQETQPQLSVDDINNYSQQSQTHNNDHMSVWNKFDFGSDQNTQQHEYNNEQTNSNGNQVNWSSISQQVGRDQPLNSGIKPESQSVYPNVNNDSTAEQLTSTTQSYKTPGTYEQSNTGSDIHNGHFNINTNQNQFWNNENSFQESHNYHESSSSYYSSSHRQEQTTNTDSYSHVNAFDTNSTNTAPLSSLWDKFDNFESLVMDNVDKGEGNAFSQGHTNNQNSYGNSMHVSQNNESTSQENLNGQMNPGLIIPINEKDKSQNKPNDTNTEKESSLDVGRGDISPEDLLDLKPDIPISTETVQIQGENSVNKNNTNAHHYIQDVQHQDHTHGQNYFHQHHGYQENNDAGQMEQQNFNQQVNKDQISSDFGKQDNLEQQNLQDFGQQANVEQQNLQDFGQQANVEQQNLQNFGQQDNLDQQNLQDFEKQDNLGQQNLQDFGQQENVEQQNLQDFGQHTNVEQQNLQDFGQQENLEQQNLQGFDKHDNLQQQNLQDFEQHENLEQHNLKDFDKQDNLQQQNLQDFGQQENLEQQNLQGFDKQDNLKQHNLQDDQQHLNKNLEQLNQDPEQPFKYSKEERTVLPKNKVESQTYLAPPAEIEQPIVKKQNQDLQSISAQTPSTEASPIEPVTEKTGFWKSVGNKLSSAKSKIASWF